MKLTLTTWSFPACDLSQAIALSRSLDINAVDVGYFYASALDKAQVLKQPEEEGKKLAGLGIDTPCLYHLFGDSLADRNQADPSSLKANAADFKQAMRFCQAAGIGTVFILPGVVNPGQSRAQALQVSAASLKEMLAIGQDAGVTVTTEPHVHSYLETPALTLELLDMVPGLKLTLDYAHFLCLGYRQEEIDPLAPHAAHMHVRQARPGFLQAKGAEGTLNVGAMLGTLRDAGFAGHLAVEFVHQNYMGTLYDDVLTETVAMRDAMRAWLQGNP